MFETILPIVQTLRDFISVLSLPFQLPVGLLVVSVQALVALRFRIRCWVDLKGFSAAHLIKAV
jgi:hypothetical protein